MSSRFAAFVAAVSLSVVGLVVGPAFAESGVSVGVTGTDFLLAGNNGNGLWRIGITNSHPDTTAAGPVTASAVTDAAANHRHGSGVSGLDVRSRRDADGPIAPSISTFRRVAGCRRCSCRLSCQVA